MTSTSYKNLAYKMLSFVVHLMKECNQRGEGGVYYQHLIIYKQKTLNQNDDFLSYMHATYTSIVPCFIADSN